MSEDVLDNLIRNQRALAKEYTFEEDGDRIEDSWHWKAADAIERLRARITELERELNPDPEAHLMGWEGDDE